MPQRYDRDRQGHVLGPGFHVEASSLSTDELTMLLLAAHMSIPSCGPEIGRIIREAIGKLLSQAPAATRREVAELLGATRPARSSDAVNSRVLAQVIAAVQRRRPIRLAFLQGREPNHLSSTKVTSYSLTETRAGWQLAGRCSWHRRVCCFDLRHVASAESLTEEADIRLRRAQ